MAPRGRGGGLTIAVDADLTLFLQKMAKLHAEAQAAGIDALKVFGAMDKQVKSSAVSVSNISSGFNKALGPLRMMANIIPGLGMSGIFLAAYNALTSFTPAAKTAAEMLELNQKALDRAGTSAKTYAERIKATAAALAEMTTQQVIAFKALAEQAKLSAEGEINSLKSSAYSINDMLKYMTDGTIYDPNASPVAKVIDSFKAAGDSRVLIDQMTGLYNAGKLSAEELAKVNEQVEIYVKAKEQIKLADNQQAGLTTPIPFLPEVAKDQYAAESEKAKKAAEKQARETKQIFDSGMRELEQDWKDSQDRMARNSLVIKSFDEQYTDLFRNISDVNKSIEDSLAPVREAINQTFTGEELDRYLERLAATEAQLKRLASREGIDGVTLALENYEAEATNMAKQLGEVVTGSFNSMEDALTNFVMTGKMDFKSLVNSILADMARMTVKQSITGPLSKLVMTGISAWANSSSGGSSMWGGMASSLSSTGYLSGGGYTTTGGVYPSAHGNIFSGPGISAYSNSIVSSPTLFPFSHGIGLMGEAGPEAIVPLKKMSSGNYGVEASGGGSGDIVLNVNIENNSSAQVSASRRNDKSGIPTLDILIKSVDEGIGAMIANGSSQVGMVMDKTRGLNSARGLYR